MHRHIPAKLLRWQSGRPSGGMMAGHFQIRDFNVWRPPAP
jgi:hypothetical protein